MTEDFDQEFRRVVAAAAALLQIDLPDEEVVDPVVFQFEAMDLMLTRDDRSEEETLVFSLPFGHVPVGREAELFGKFLDANLFWIGTAGATIGVDPESNAAHLCLQVPLRGISAEEVAGRAAEIIEAGKHWKQVIEGGVAGHLSAEDFPAFRI